MERPSLKRIRVEHWDPVSDIIDGIECTNIKKLVDKILHNLSLGLKGKINDVGIRMLEWSTYFTENIRHLEWEVSDDDFRHRKALTDLSNEYNTQQFITQWHTSMNILYKFCRDRPNRDQLIKIPHAMSTLWNEYYEHTRNVNENANGCCFNHVVYHFALISLLHVCWEIVIIICNMTSNENIADRIEEYRHRVNKPQKKIRYV